MHSESKVMDTQIEREKSISDHEGFCQDSSNEGNTTEQDMFVRIDLNARVWCKCRNCSTMKTEKECLCF